MILPRWALPVAIGAALIASHGLVYLHGVNVDKARSDAVIARNAENSANALTELYAERDSALADLEFKRAGIEKELEKALYENRDRNDRIAAGTQRVYVRASCPAVPATASNAGGHAPVAAELDPRYRHVVSRLRERALTWEAWGKACQAELQARSIK